MDPGEAADGAGVAFTGVRFARGSRLIFDGLTCRFPSGRISVVLGGSGSGKSTLLRILAGLERPASGRIDVDGEGVLDLDQSDALRRHRRRIGMMFQGGALLNSLTVYENVALPLREHGKEDEGLRSSPFQAS